ncbi:MAG: pantoate--beta-alanine ligase, partial [Parvibaculaceae bacterium]
HEGHLDLVRAGLKKADRCVVTIFVNPKQFGPTEDLSRYPRDERGDAEKLARAGAHLVFAPAPEEMYGQGFATSVSPGGPAKAGLEDRFRPHFFDGVATVVTKLLNQAQCDFAMFGEKDFQQLKVVTQLVRDLDIPTRIVPVRTRREKDGLAMSSRNAYLSPEERAKAPALHAALKGVAEAISAGGKIGPALIKARESLAKVGFAVDYLEARHAETLAPAPKSHEPIRLLVAARLGATRLIDNVAVRRK